MSAPTLSHDWSVTEEKVAEAVRRILGIADPYKGYYLAHAPEVSTDSIAT